MSDACITALKNHAESPGRYNASNWHTSVESQCKESEGDKNLAKEYKGCVDKGTDTGKARKACFKDLQKLLDGTASLGPGSKTDAEDGHSALNYIYPTFSLVSPLVITIDYAAGIIPDGIGLWAPITTALLSPQALMPTGASAFTLPTGKELAEQPSSYIDVSMRLGQLFYSGANVVMGTARRPEHLHAPEGEEGTYDHDEDFVKLQRGALLKFVEPTEIAVGQKELAYALNYTYRPEKDALTRGFSMGLDALTLGTIAFQRTAGEFSPVVLNAELDRLAQMCSAFGCAAEETLGVRVREEQAVNTLFGTFSEAQENNLRAAEHATRIRLQTEFNQLGGIGPMAGIATNTGLFLLRQWAPWQKENHTTVGEHVRDGLLAGLDVGAAFMADGDWEYMFTLSMTAHHIDSTVRMMFPRVAGRHATEWFKGADTELGLDPFMTGSLMLGTYEVAGPSVRGWFAGQRDARHSGDWRNKADMGANILADAGTIVSTIFHNEKEENQISSDAKALTYGVMAGSIALGHGIYALSHYAFPPETGKSDDDSSAPALTGISTEVTPAGPNAGFSMALKFSF